MIMPDTTPTTPTPVTKTRAPRGLIDQGLEDDITLAEDCLQESAKPEIAAALLIREWIPAEQAALSASVALCTEYQTRIKEFRTGKETRTSEEDAARTEILHALDPILKGARRAHANGSAERKAYGIGTSISSHSTSDLLALVLYASDQLSSVGGAAPKDKLKGVLPTEIAALAPLHLKYKNADWAQGDAETQAVQLLAKLKLEISTVLNPHRRDLQGAADQAYTHRDPVNAAQRKAFGLQADRPLVD